MARATRSSAQQGQETEKQIDSATPRGKAGSKKRKRTSIAENDDQPAVKQPRSNDVSIKEGSQELDGIPAANKLPELQNAGDLPIDDADAQKILDILEMWVFGLLL
jgi:hypothetical protein